MYELTNKIIYSSDNSFCMKNIVVQLAKIFLAAFFSCLFLSGLAQTTKDTVKTGKANDPMVVNPGQNNDSMAVRPTKPNDDNAVLTDTGFINKNIADNMMEIQLSKIGRDKGSGAEIKKIADQLISDHTSILNSLKKLAAIKKTGATDAPMPNLPQANMKPSATFNQAWASQMLTMHVAKIAELESFITVTQDAAIKAVVTNALHKIRAHQQLLEKIPGAKADIPNTTVH